MRWQVLSLIGVGLLLVLVIWQWPTASGSPLPTPKPSGVASGTAAGTTDSTKTYDRRVVPVELATAPPADGARFQAAIARLRGITPRALYDHLSQAFAADAALGERLARARLRELLGEVAFRWADVAAVLAAWLDAHGDADAILATAADAVRGRGEFTDRNAVNRACNLGLAFAACLRDSNLRASLPASDAATSARLLDALLRAAGVHDLPSDAGMTLAVTLGWAPAGDLRAMATLTAWMRNAASSPLREAAAAALGAIADPREVLAAVGSSPRVAVSESECLQDCAILSALHNALNRHPDQRSVLQQWVSERLLLPANSEHQVRLQQHLLQQLTAGDATALRTILTRLAAESESAGVRDAAARALNRAR